MDGLGEGTETSVSFCDWSWWVMGERYVVHLL